MIRYVVGIDEAGRGPLAGPVSVGAVVVRLQGKKTGRSGPIKLPKHPLFKGVKNSKALSPVLREEWFRKIREARAAGSLDYAVACVSAKIIDEKGIVFAIRQATKRILKKLSVPPHETQILLDGSLYAPEHFLYQETIIRGDETVPIISLASIAAKVVRDRKMVRLSREYPEFDFHIHKGYGTLSHRQAIRKLGPCELHRRSFLTGILG